MKEYNGHRSWNAWNVSLWINNDEALYRRAVDLVAECGINRAAQRLLAELPPRTPDVAQYNYTSLRADIEDIL